MQPWQSALCMATTSVAQQRDKLATRLYELLLHWLYQFPHSVVPEFLLVLTFAPPPTPRRGLCYSG